ncbi:MAG TPA: Ldh family oxidoreductase [Gaiellales bacterium]|jgi:ureidoglycolate dehydrogenase (NAD+)|nr:Ldh family oxidoreductase [Gaiellales bacterium]
MATVAIDRLEAAMLARAAGLGFGDADARELVDHFLGAELRGASGHGVERLRWISAFADLDPSAQPRLVERDGGIARWDAAGTLGYLALSRALAQELADPPAGARLVVVRHGFPTGRLGHYAERVAAAGLCCLVTATSTARISHPTGGPPLLGTNPLCLALPGDPAPALVDVSMGRITYGAVLKAAATGSPLPAGAAVNGDGGPATDPADVTAGTAGLLPFGGDQAYKGFALALLVELFCRSLAGAHGFSAVALVARPQALPAEEIRAALDGRRFPGDAGAERRRGALAAGTLDLPDDLWSWIDAPVR